MNLRLATILYFVLLILLLVVGYAWAADNKITVDQIGNNNQITITQTGVGHTATANLGSMSDVDYTVLQITQEGTGLKTATIKVDSGINNAVTVLQQGSGNHISSIQNLAGNANNITITQQGNGKHEFNIINGTGNTNSGNTISSTQVGGVGSDKWFNVWLNGATNATVNVVQDNATAADQASMNIQCMAGTCGGFSYIKN
jgi:hypothetical protein